MASTTAIATFIGLVTSSLFVLSSASKPYYQSLFISPFLSSNNSVARHLYTLTHRPHVAGTDANAATAAYVLSVLSSDNITSHVASYRVLLTYPRSRSLTLTLPSPATPAVKFDLRQEVYPGDPYAGVAGEVLPTFHAYAMSGSVEGPVAYVNYGRVEDYDTLRDMGVNVSGAVVLARYGKIFRGDIVSNAQDAGAVGVVIFSDRKDYGGGGTGKWFPEGPWLPPSGVQVGSVYKGVGDPTTPGWPSTESCERLSDDEVKRTGDVPLIPSLPVSGTDGAEIIKSIGGEVAKDDWQGDEYAPVYRVGPGPGVLTLNYKAKEVIRKIENVIGIIEGTDEPDRYVILGNHRDAWTFGAVDPSSGTAAMLEIADRLRRLQEEGWQPRRTVVFCSWDAEEYRLIGSTEWVEENRQTLASKAVAYLNVDSAVAGDGFQAAATPQLDQLIIEASKKVQDPDNSSQTIYESWIGNNSRPMVERLGSDGTDFSAFVQHIGIPATNMAFGKQGYPVYHSMYDDFAWMKMYGDPMFHRHVAAASIWGLVALKLADEELLPFNYLPYAQELQINAEELKGTVSDRGIDLTPLFKSIDMLRKAAAKVNREKRAMKECKEGAQPKENKPWKVRELNDRLMMTERAFTDGEGLAGRPWYKHLIYAPSKHNSYGSASFPGVNDAFENAKSLNTSESWRSVQHEVWRVSRAITQASLVLSGDLT